LADFHSGQVGFVIIDDFMPEEMARAVKVATPAVFLSGLAIGYMCSSVVCLMFILFLFCRFSSDVPASQTCPMLASFFHGDLGCNQPQDSTDQRTITQASNVNLYQQSEMEEGATTGGLGPKLTKNDLGKLPRVNVVFDAQARHYGVL